MTKERKIAIEMWKYIRDNYKTYREYRDTYEGEDAVHNLKMDFLKGKGINWAMNCWFCEYIGHRGRYLGTSRCKLCPLKDCDRGPYLMLTHGCTQPLYVEACNQIIRALGGTV